MIKNLKIRRKDSSKRFVEKIRRKNSSKKETERNRNIQKEPYKRTKSKEPRLQQQQHKSRFLEASLVRQANGKLKNQLRIISKSQIWF